MRSLNWNVTQFKSIVSFPSDAAGGAEAYAQDMVNLRVDRWGHLRQRQAIRAFTMSKADGISPEGISVAGVGAAGGRVYWLTSDGKLFFASTVPATPFNVRDLSGLQGRLSVIGEIGDDDLVVLVSEGAADHGVVIHGSRGEALGLDAPSESDFAISLGSGSVALDEDYTFYHVTYSGEGIFGEMESGSFRYAVKLRQNLGVGDQQALLNAGSYYLRFRLNAKPPDTRLTHLNIYRSDTRHAEADTLDSQITYHRIHQLALAENAGNYPQNFQDQTLKTTVTTTNPYKDNSPLPGNQLALFNDRLFCPNGDELRFSEVDFGAPQWWRWPVVNSIRTGKPVEFCASYRGMLLFGGADGLYRLTGTSLANFQYDQISARGPVSPYAWSVLANAFAFVGSDGLYLTDGTSAPETAAELKGFFNRYEVEGGFVGMLPNKASLWGVHRRNKATNAVDVVYFVNEDGAWTRLAEGSDATHIRQYASVKFATQPLLGVIADQLRAPRLIEWAVDDVAVDGVTAYSGQNAPPTEAIAWSWESQQLDWNSQGIGEEMKTFEEAVISGTADNAVDVAVTIDDKAPVTKAVSLNRTGIDRFNPVRVRIGRRGFACRVKVSGSGSVTLRGLRVEASV